MFTMSDGLNDALKVTLDDFTQHVEESFKLTINSDIFVWGSTTVRSDGSVVGDPRNAIDTGNLLESMEVVSKGRLTNAIVFNAEYTPIVFDQSSVDIVDFTLARINT